MIKLLSKYFIKDYKNYEDNKVREQYSVLTGIVGICLNVISSSIKIIFGIISNSIAILSDGLNNLADMGSSLISIVVAKLSNRKPDKDHPFGHGRFEYVGSLVVAFLVMLMGFELVKGSIEKIINPEPIEFSIGLVVVLVISILIKIYMFAYNKIYGEKTKSLVLKATATDSLSDSITTIVILITTILSLFVDWPLDGIAGTFVGILILYAGFNIAKEAVETLLGVPPTEETIKNISNYVMSGKGILGIHDLMVHDYGPGRQFASVHAEVDEKGNIIEIHEMIDAIEAKIAKELGIIMTIHMDPISTSQETLKHKQTCIDAIKEIDSKFKLHDFRMVNGEKQINVIFDLVIPHEYLNKDIEELRKQIINKLKEKNPKYYPVVLIECDFA